MEYKLYELKKQRISSPQQMQPVNLSNKHYLLVIMMIATISKLNRLLVNSENTGPV